VPHHGLVLQGAGEGLSGIGCGGGEGDYRQVPQCFRHARASCSRRGAKPDQGRGDGWGTPQGRVERDD
ncbi:unnamed protein product, partial [Ectocarpus sp. 12 AP-2014]